MSLFLMPADDAHAPRHGTTVEMDAGLTPGSPLSIVDTVTILRRITLVAVRHAKGNTAGAGTGKFITVLF